MNSKRNSAELNFKNEKLSTRTREIYSNAVHRYFAFCKKAKNRNMLNPHSIEAFLGTFDAPGTRNLARAGLKSYFQKLHENSKSETRVQVWDAFNKVRPVKPEKKQINYLHIDEIMTMVKAMTPRVSTLVEGLFWTGCRVSELIKITHNDYVQTEMGWAEVRVIGKGRRERTVYMPTKVLRRAIQVHQGKHFLYETENGKPYNRKQVTDEIRKQARVKAGLRAYAHLMRHSRAMHLLQKEVRLHEIAAYLGHASPSTTLAYYMHGLPKPERLIEK